MSSINITNARKNLYKLVEEVQDSHMPVTITGKTASAVLVAEEDWNSIQETMYLLSIPGMRESLVEGMKQPLSEGVEGIDW